MNTMCSLSYSLICYNKQKLLSNLLWYKHKLAYFIDLGRPLTIRPDFGAGKSLEDAQDWTVQITFPRRWFYVLVRGVLKWDGKVQKRKISIYVANYY